MCIFISLNLPWNHHPIEMACIIIVQAAPFGIINLNKGMGCNTWKDQPVKSFFLRSGWNLVIITLLQTTKDIKREDLRFLFGPSIENQDFMYPLSQLPNFPAQNKSLAPLICSRCSTPRRCLQRGRGDTADAELLETADLVSCGMATADVTGHWEGSRETWASVIPRWIPPITKISQNLMVKSLRWPVAQWVWLHPDVSNKKWLCHHRMYIPFPNHHVQGQVFKWREYIVILF